MKSHVKIVTMCFVFIVGAYPLAFAQGGFPLLSQQMFSRSNLNPASSSASNYVDAFLLVRNQWVGFENAPSTQILNLQGYIPEANSSVSASITSDKIGLSYGLNAKFGYAYHFRVGEEGYLALGVNGGILYKSYRGSEIITDQDYDDPSIPKNDVSDSKPDFDFGAVYSTPSFSVGASAVHLTSFIYRKDGYFSPKIAYHGFMEYRARVTEGFLLIPNLSMGYLGTSTSMYLEGNLTALLMQSWWIGVSYRMEDAVVAMTGLQIGDRFKVGYAYDYSIGAARGYSKGTHEIMLNVRIKSTNEFDDAIKTPRFFD